MEFNATFLISAISFVVFTFIMNAIFYKPLTEIIEEREKFINKTLDDAKNSQNIAQELLKNKEETLCKTAEETRQILSTATEDANSKGNELTLEAKRQAQYKIDEAKNNINSETEFTYSELKTRVKELAEDIASKILKEEIHITEVNNELIDRILV